MKVACWIIDQHPGKWEVSELDCNQPAQAFWRKVIAEYTGENFIDTRLDQEEWHGPVQVFESGKELK